MTSVRQTLNEALEHHGAGRWDEAERLCRLVLEEHPAQGDAWHLLGLQAHQGGRSDLAVEQIGRAVELDGANPAAHNNLGLALAAVGDPVRAEARFRLAVLLAPDFAEAHSNLGATLRTLGRWADAEASLLRSLELRPGFAAAHLNLALVHRSLGRFAAALDHAEAAVRDDPGSTAAASLRADLQRALGRAVDAESTGTVAPIDDLGLANALLAQERFKEAESLGWKVVRLRPDLAEARNSLGAALLGLGRPIEAETQLLEAIQRAPGLIEARVNLGAALLALDRLDEAAACLALVVENAPEHGDALILLGKALRGLGALDDARNRLDQAVRLRPGSAEARTELAVTLHRLGLTDEANRQFQAAVSLAGDSAHDHAALGQAFLGLGWLDQAEASDRRSLAIRPDHSPTLARLASVLGDQGRDVEARALLQGAAARRDARLQVARAALLPPLYDSMDDLRARRVLLTEELDQLHRGGVRLDPTDQTVPTLFFLAYQGENDRDLQRSLARLVAPPETPRLDHRPPTGGRPIRVGFLSSHFHNHTIGQLMKGVIAHLSRDEVTVVVLSASDRDDETARLIQGAADEFVNLPRNLPAARRAVAGRALDVLVYTDIGMDSFSYTLAFSRLAPVQCATWGHPVTTGLETIDHYLSSDLLEGPNADDHYTEHLVRLPAVSVYYDRPLSLGPVKSRAALGLPERGNLYVCPQSLFKFHPEIDAVLGAILRRDPQGRLILLNGWHARWSEVLQARLGRTIGDVVDRVQFVPRLGHVDFRHLCARADVLLDPIHFGGGHTSYEALALGTPIVTLPSPFLRGRITQALYRTMGVTDCIASSEQEYIDLSVKLGTDPDRRAAVKGAILAENHRIFQNVGALRGLEDFFRAVV